MLWMYSYAAVAVVAAIAVFLLAEWVRSPHVPAPEHAGFYAAIAGLLWPVVIVGIAQWGLIAAVASRLRRTARPVEAASAQRVLQAAAR